MTLRENIVACLTDKPYDTLPIIHFGFWGETLEKWQAEGHLTAADVADWGREVAITKLGFDCEWQPNVSPNSGLLPGFTEEVLETRADGSQIMRDSSGVTVMVNPTLGATIPMEISHLLTDRESWEEHYLPRLQYSSERLAAIPADDGVSIRGLHIGSLCGTLRNFTGVPGLAYLQADDEDLFDEIVETFGTLCYRCAEETLATGAVFDFAHYWEDICFKNGPLVSPRVFAEKFGPQYKRISELLVSHGIEIISLDCDGMIDSLIPTWLNNGVNTMFPIEVGTWEASIAPWREKYGKAIRGVGGMDKNIFAKDRAAIDAEIARLLKLVAGGGFIPCPDHRIPPDAKFDLIRYYTDRLREKSI